MELEEIIKTVASKLKNGEYKTTAHFLEQCNERNLDINEVIPILKTCQIVGLITQSDKRYKIIFIYRTNK